MKQYVVLGLGVFGSKVAKTLVESGGEVVAVDNDEECVKRVSEYVTRAVCGDITDIEFLKALGLEDFDYGIVAIGDHIEESLLGVMNLKEIGIKNIIAKSKNKRFEMVLEKVGATKVVRPEKETGVQIARELLYKNIIDLKEIDDDYSVVEMKVPNSWVNHSIIQLDLNKKYGINVLGIKENNKMNINIDANAPLTSSQTLLLISDTNKIQTLDLKLD